MASPISKKGGAEIQPAQTHLPCLALPVVGEGSHATVYEGGFYNGKKVVLKTYQRKHNSLYQKELKAFKRITERAIQHENIIPFYGEQETLEYKSLIFERIDKSLLKTLEEHESIKRSIRFRQLNGITDAIIFLHSHSIIHKDLKSDNVLIRADNTAVLIDFSCAKCIDEETTATWLAEPCYYLPPEVSIPISNPKKLEEDPRKIDSYGLGFIAREICYENTTAHFMRTWDSFKNDKGKKIFVGRQHFKYIKEKCIQDSCSQNSSSQDSSTQDSSTQDSSTQDSSTQDSAIQYQHSKGLTFIIDNYCLPTSPFTKKEHQTFMEKQLIRPAMNILPWDRISVDDFKARLLRAQEALKD